MTILVTGSEKGGSDDQNFNPLFGRRVHSDVAAGHLQGLPVYFRIYRRKRQHQSGGDPPPDRPVEKNGLVRVSAGVTGMVLAKNPEKITLLDIYRAMGASDRDRLPFESADRFVIHDDRRGSPLPATSAKTLLRSMSRKECFTLPDCRISKEVNNFPARRVKPSLQSNFLTKSKSPSLLIAPSLKLNSIFLLFGP